MTGPERKRLVERITAAGIYLRDGRIPDHSVYPPESTQPDMGRDILRAAALLQADTIPTQTVRDAITKMEVRLSFHDASYAGGMAAGILRKALGLVEEIEEHRCPFCTRLLEPGVKEFLQDYLQKKIDKSHKGEMRMILGEEFVKAVKGPIYQTWDYIGSDAIQCAHECGERMGKVEAMEVTLDADRLKAHGGEKGKAANELIKQAINDHGYVKVLNFLASALPLT